MSSARNEFFRNVRIAREMIFNNSSGVYQFLPGAWNILNEFGFDLVPWP